MSYTIEHEMKPDGTLRRQRVTHAASGTTRIVQAAETVEGVIAAMAATLPPEPPQVEPDDDSTRALLLRIKKLEAALAAK